MAGSTMLSLSWSGTLAFAICFHLIYRFCTSRERHRRLAQTAAQPKRYCGRFPLGIDIFWQLIEAHRNSTHLELGQSLFEKHGHTTELHFLGQGVIFTDDPENIEAMLQTKFKDFGRGAMIRSMFHLVLGDSVFSADGDLWRHGRSLTRPTFSKQRTSNLDIVEKHIQRAIDLISPGEKTVNLQDIFFRFSFDASLEHLVGELPSSWDNHQILLSKSFDRIQEWLSLRLHAGPLYFLVPEFIYAKDVKTIDDCLFPIVEKAIRTASEDKSCGDANSSKFSVLQAMCQTTDDKKFLRDQLVGLLLAGRDTTAAALSSWTFYELARHPQVYARLRNEVLEKIGSKVAPTIDTLNSLEFVKKVINESTIPDLF
ncbi:Cytochrome P450 52A13 [Neolecta irregularis DAH-3]|uniref:Cytochrome P450 52A13 n=1 Tax=Neolecta irregularis (strain DAH-3) TaxID=1198029 RepID=A0A1U7LTB1_NEOID|nr:Cytochrome P450 52A13 [Neolecta irregularis DAH-3]|eukprot:OLL25823.1 Cytochrome P450 52A13 [Neolecta irregularis DAH-3]